MALKDWKKTHSWKTGMTFDNRKINAFIQVYYAENYEPKWRFTIHQNGKIKEDNLFKTKSQALAFAKAYMRSH